MAVVSQVNTSQYQQHYSKYGNQATASAPSQGISNTEEVSNHHGGSKEDPRHNLENPCCELARSTVMRMITSLNPSVSVDSESNKKTNQTSTSSQPSCFTVMVAREIHSMAAKESVLQPETSTKKKKNKKKKKKSASASSSATDELTKCVSIDDQDKNEVTTGILTASPVAVHLSTTASAPQTKSQENVTDHELAAVTPEDPPFHTAMKILSPSSQSISTESETMKLYSNRRLDKFIQYVSVPQSTHESPEVGRKSGKGKAQRTQDQATDGNLKHPHAFATLDLVRKHAKSIQCLVCKRNCMALIKHYADRVYHQSLPSKPQNLSENAKFQTIAMTLVPNPRNLSSSVKQNESKLTVPVLGLSSQIVEDQVEMAFSYELLEEGAGFDAAYSALKSSSSTADDLSLTIALACPQKADIPAGSGADSTNRTPTGLSDPPYESISVVLPSTFLEGEDVQKVESLTKFVASALLPLGYDPCIDTDEKNKKSEAEVAKDKQEQNQKKETQKKLIEEERKNNPFGNLRWTNEVYTGQFFGTKTYQPPETYNAQHRLAEYDLQFDEIRKKRQDIISSVNQVKNEIQQTRFSTKVKQDVAFRQASQIRGIDVEMSNLSERMTLYLIEVTKISFCSFVTKCRLDTKPSGSDNVDASLFLNVNKSKEIQTDLKKVWTVFEKVMSDYMAHAIDYRGQQMYGWQQDREKNLACSDDVDNVLLGAVGFTNGDTPGINYIPQLFHNQHLRNQLAFMLESQLQVLNCLFRELDTFSSSHMKDLMILVDHHIQLIPHLPKFEGLETEMATMRLELGYTINKGTPHEVKQEHSDKDTALKTLASKLMTDMLDHHRERLIQLVEGILSTYEDRRSSSPLSKNEFTWIREWKSNYEQEFYELKMTIFEYKNKAAQELGAVAKIEKRCANETKTEGNKLHQVGMGAETNDTAKQKRIFILKTNATYKFTNALVALNLARWRLTSQFYAQYYHLQLLIQWRLRDVDAASPKSIISTGSSLSTRSMLQGDMNGVCGQQVGAQRRLCAIISSLLYKWLEERCMEWNADETQRELLEGFDLFSEIPSSISNDKDSAGVKAKKKKKKTASKASTISSTSSALTPAMQVLKLETTNKLHVSASKVEALVKTDVAVINNSSVETRIRGSKHTNNTISVQQTRVQEEVVSNTEQGKSSRVKISNEKDLIQITSNSQNVGNSTLKELQPSSCTEILAESMNASGTEILAECSDINSNKAMSATMDYDTVDTIIQTQKTTVSSDSSSKSLDEDLMRRSDIILETEGPDLKKQLYDNKQECTSQTTQMKESQNISNENVKPAVTEPRSVDVAFESFQTSTQNDFDSMRAAAFLIRRIKCLSSSSTDLLPSNMPAKIVYLG